MRRAVLVLQRFTPVKLPALSPSMAKGTIQEWKVKVGDPVTEGTLWCVLGTDKAGLDFTERVREGFVAKLYAQNGEEHPVGKVIALLVDEKEHIGLADTYKVVEDVAIAEPVKQAPTESHNVSKTVSSSTNAGGEKKKLYGGSLDDALKASGPAVALLASLLADRSVLETISPSGKGGRFTKGDLHGLVAVPSPAPSSTTAEVKPAPEPPKNISAAAAPGAVVATPVVDFSVSDSGLLKKLFASK